MSSGRVIVYGGRGALGSALVDHFLSKSFWVLSVDVKENDKSHANIVVPENVSWLEQENLVLESMDKIIGADKADAILCVAGGWAGGNAQSAKMIKNADLMWKQSVWSSSICARMATMYLRPGGLIQFTGAAAALSGTGDMIGYGMAKAAVHQLTKSLASQGSKLPENCTSLALLPVCLDTPMNRKFMPKADFKKWTPLGIIGDLLHSWVVCPSSRPQNGSLVKLITVDGETKTEIV